MFSVAWYFRTRTVCVPDIQRAPEVRVRLPRSWPSRRPIGKGNQIDLARSNVAQCVAQMQNPPKLAGLFFV